MASWKFFPPMLERLRRFRSLEKPAQKLFLRSSMLLPLISLSLKVRGFLATKATLEGLLKDIKTPQNSGSMDATAALTVRMMRAAARYGIGRPSCLEESLALWYLLKRQGIDCKLRIGIRKGEEPFAAHAWVERDGAPVNPLDEEHRHYAAFESEFSASTLEGK